MTPEETTAYLRKKRKENWEEVKQFYPLLTEEEWCSKEHHWQNNTKVYHSFSDYCDD